MEIVLDIEPAREAMRKQEWDSAIEQLTRVCETEPRWAEIWTDLWRALRLSGQLKRAESVPADTVKRFPEHLWARFEYGMVALYRQDWDTAIARLAQFREDAPQQLAGYAAGGEALIGAGRLDEAEQLLTDAMRRFPTDV